MFFPGGVGSSSRAAVRGMLVAGAGALLCSGAWAQSSVTLFGGLDLGGRHVSNSAGSMNTMQSGNNYTSRIGLRGVEDLGGGMKASFWLESTVNGTSGATGAGNSFWDRRSTVSLSGAFGELRLGRDYTPMFRAFASTDVFGYVGVAGMGTLYSAGAAAPVKDAFGTGATSIARVNSAVQYYTPNTLGGFYFNGMYAKPGFGSIAGEFDFWGARAGYASGPIDVSVYGGATKIKPADKSFQLYGVAAAYKLGDAQLQGGLTQMKYLQAKQTNQTLGVDWAIGVGQVRATYHRIKQAGLSSGGAALGGDGANVFGIGYVYNLSKRTAVYGTAAFTGNKGKAQFTLPGGPSGNAPGTSARGYEVGLRHIF